MKNRWEMEENQRSKYAFHISRLNEKIVRSHWLSFVRCHIHGVGFPSQRRVFLLHGSRCSCHGQTRQWCVCCLLRVKVSLRWFRWSLKVSHKSGKGHRYQMHANLGLNSGSAIICVILGKLFKLYGPQFPHL